MEEAQLVETEEGLALTRGALTLCADFARLLPRAHPQKIHQELLVKAAKIKGVHPQDLLVVDATAGLGEDSFLLAAAGFNVLMFERDPIIAALLEDALSRATRDERLAAIVARMTLRKEDSVAALLGSAAEDSAGVGTNSAEVSATGETPASALTSAPAASTPAASVGTLTPDIVFLDPMFPARTKSAAVKKKFQLIHELEKPCNNEEELLAAALATHPRKVVIKRPPRGPWLAGRKPSYSLTGKAVRYDCIVNA